MQSAQSIDRAAWLNKLALIGYIGSLVVVAILTFLSWWAGSHLQDAIQKDADARIAEADSKAAVAYENAGKANERAGLANAEAARANEGLAQSNVEIAQLTAEAEKAKAERAEADKKIATAKADAAKAKEGTAKAEVRSLEASAEVSRLQVVVANAETRRAEAEKALLALQERIRFRHLSDAQKQALALRGLKGELRMKGVASDPEAANFVQEITSALRKAGLEINGIEVRLTPLVGFVIQVRDLQNPPSLARELGEALRSIGFDVREEASPTVMGDLVYLVVGSKPHD